MLTPRERRVITGGVVIVAAALSLTYLVRPYVDRWRARTAERAAAAASAAALDALAQNQGAMERAADSIDRALIDAPRRILRARSATLGASALQSLVQGAADASHVVLTRVVVSPDSLDGGVPAGATERTRGPDRGLYRPPSLPVQLSAYGDITGITRFLTVLATGPQMVVTDRVTLQRNSALAGAPDVVQVTLTAHAPLWLVDAAGTAPDALPPEGWRQALDSSVPGSLTPHVAAMNDAAQRAINGNVFSATRRAPAVAFVVPGEATVALGSPVPMDTVRHADADYPALSGIVTVNGERQALLQLRADDGVPRLYRVGSAHAGYQLLAIDRDAVTLLGPTGRRTLGLSTRPASASREPLP